MLKNNFHTTCYKCFFDTTALVSKACSYFGLVGPHNDTITLDLHISRWPNTTTSHITLQLVYIIYISDWANTHLHMYTTLTQSIYMCGSRWLNPPKCICLVDLIHFYYVLCWPYHYFLYWDQIKSSIMCYKYGAPERTPKKYLYLRYLVRKSYFFLWIFFRTDFFSRWFRILFSNSRRVFKTQSKGSFRSEGAINRSKGSKMQTTGMSSCCSRSY